MARFIADGNKTLLIQESGTYGSVSGTGVWLGYVHDHMIEEKQGVTQIRYQGTANRNISRHVDGPIDNVGILNYYPQDFRLLGFALGSIVDTGSPTPSTHVLSELNSGSGNAFTSGITTPFMSFTLEDSHVSPVAGQNFIRTANGCMIDSWEMSFQQGKIIDTTVKYVAQNIVWTSGATTAVTEDTSSKPYLWADVKVHIPSGTVFPEITSGKFAIKNGLVAPHYVNGSRVIYTPYMTNRDYSLDLTQETDSARLITLYSNYFKSGTEFNVMLEVNSIQAGAGSQNAYFVLSGCKLDPMSNPSPMEKIDISTSTIKPKSCLVNVKDLVYKYNPW